MILKKVGEEFLKKHLLKLCYVIYVTKKLKLLFLASTPRFIG